MSMRKSRLRRRIAGQSATVEMTLMTIIATAAIILGIQQSTHVAADRQAEIVGEQMVNITNAAGTYARGNYAAIVNSLSGTTVAQFSLSTAIPNNNTAITSQTLYQAGLVPQNVSPINRYGQTYSLLAFKDTSSNLHMMLATTGGETLDDATDAVIARRIGNAGGYWATTAGIANASLPISGIFGGWSYSSTSWGNLITAGHPVATLDYLLQPPGQADWLNRHDNKAPITSEVNSMHANIYFLADDLPSKVPTPTRVGLVGTGSVDTQTLTNNCVTNHLNEASYGVGVQCPNAGPGTIKANSNLVIGPSTATIITPYGYGAATTYDETTGVQGTPSYAVIGTKGFTTTSTDGIIWGSDNAKFAIAKDNQGQRWLTYLPAASTADNMSPLGIMSMPSTNNAGSMMKADILYSYSNSSFYVSPIATSQMNNIHTTGYITSEGVITANAGIVQNGAAGITSYNGNIISNKAALAAQGNGTGISGSVYAQGGNLVASAKDASNGGAPTQGGSIFADNFLVPSLGPTSSTLPSETHDFCYQSGAIAADTIGRIYSCQFLTGNYRWNIVGGGAAVSNPSMPTGTTLYEIPIPHSYCALSSIDGTPNGAAITPLYPYGSKYLWVFTRGASNLASGIYATCYD